MTEENFLDLVQKLNDQQRKIFNDFVEKIISGMEEDHFYIHIGGEAGTGKSFVLRLMIDAVKELGKSPGRELDKLVSLTIAQTGVAEYLVNGTIIESENAAKKRKKLCRQKI